jgi:hypothetical protein
LLVSIALFAVALFGVNRLIELSKKVSEQREAQRYQDELLEDLRVMVIVLAMDFVDVMPPPAVLDSQGKPLRSWRVPLLASWALPPGLDVSLPWNAPSNLAYSSSLVRGFGCLIISGKRSEETSLFAITGPDTGFDTSREVRISDLDGELILIMEVVNSGVHWMQPGDYDVQQLTACEGTLRDCLKSTIRDRVHVLFADGEVWAISDRAPMSRVKPFLTITGAGSHSREKELGEFCLEKWTFHSIVKQSKGENEIH